MAGELAIRSEAPRLEHAEVVGEIVLDAGEVHLVEEKDVRTCIAALGLELRFGVEQQARRIGGHDELIGEEVVVAEQALAVDPVRADRDEGTGVLVGQQILERECDLRLPRA